MNKPLSVPLTERQRRAFNAARRDPPIISREVIRLPTWAPDLRVPKDKKAA
jgi:hypothetical protein